MTRSLTLCGTGHRPKKIVIGAQNAYAPAVHQRLVALAAAALERHRPTRVISGMALGWDTALAEAALTLGIPLAAYVPFAGQESLWPPASQTRFNELCAAAAEVRIICPGGYSAAKMQVRNEAMVRDSGLVLALWNGDLSGGTYNCVRFAQQQRVALDNLWRHWERHAARPAPALLAAA